MHNAGDHEGQLPGGRGPDYVHHMSGGRTIECYGTPRDDSNFEVVCTDEFNDGIWANSVPTRSTEREWRGGIGNRWVSSTSWSRICNFLLENYRKDIEQITAC